VPWTSFGWLAHLIEAAAVIVVILCAGAAIAIFSVWLLSRFARNLAGPQPEEPEKYEPELDLDGGPVIPIEPENSTPQAQAPKSPSSPC